MLDFNEIFIYDETSPSCLRWKEDRIGSNGRVVVTAGSPAGCLSGEGYWQVGITNKRYQVHRVIVYMHGTDCSRRQIDHINQNRKDNRIVNLRVVTNSLNQRNIGKKSNNTTGVTGVSLQINNLKGGGCNKYYVSQWVDENKKLHQKKFSVLLYGEEKAFDLAKEYRTLAIEALNKQGAGYTADHGK